MIPCSCAASRASAIWRAMGRASSSGIGPLAIRSWSVGAFDQFQNERPRVPGLFQPVDGRDVGMVQGRQDLGFPLEAGEAFWIGRKRIRQHLDRHVAVQGRIVGAVHLAHATRADLRGDFVDAELGAWTESHVGERPSSPQGETGRTVGPQSAARKPYLDSFRKPFLIWTPFLKPRRVMSGSHGDRTADVSSASVWSVQGSGPVWKFARGVPIDVERP